MEGVQIGTLKWKWLDDDGRTHTFLIPKSYYVPQGKVRLLSPQHWAQTRRDFSPIQGTTSETTATHVILRWNQRQHRLTIPLGRTDNVATLHMAPVYNKYSTFCAEAAIDESDDANPLTIDPTIMSDDESDMATTTPVPTDRQEQGGANEYDWKPPNTLHTNKMYP